MNKKELLRVAVCINMNGLHEGFTGETMMKTVVKGKCGNVVEERL